MSETHDDVDDYTPERYDEESAAVEEYQQCLSYVSERAPIDPDDTVVDMGTGTGTLALKLASRCERVLGRDIDDEWLRYAREKATERGVDNVSFAHGSFREPNVEGAIDVVVTSYALHTVYDGGREGELRAAVEGLSSLNPRHLVVADRMSFGPPELRDGYETLPRMGTVANLLADAGFTLTDVKVVGDSEGVLVAARADR